MGAVTPQNNRKGQKYIIGGPEHLLFAGGTAAGPARAQFRVSLKAAAGEGNSQRELSAPKGDGLSRGLGRGFPG